MKEVYGFLSFITKTRKHTHTCKRREKVKVEGSEVEASALFSSLLYFFLINSPSSYFTNTRVDVPSSSILTLITGRKYPKDTNKQRNNNKKQVFWQCFAHVYASASLCFFFFFLLFFFFFDYPCSNVLFLSRLGQQQQRSAHRRVLLLLLLFFFLIPAFFVCPFTS